MDLLKTLVFHGQVVTGDAMFCQRDLCEEIVDSVGVSFIPVKDNQPNLLRDIRQEFAAAEAAFPPWAQKEREQARQSFRQVNKGYGRIETREITRSVGLNQHLDWPHVGQVCRVHRTRKTPTHCEEETVYYVTSLAANLADAETLLNLSRRHWGAIENGLYHIRDATLKEDHCTIFRGHAPQKIGGYSQCRIELAWTIWCEKPRRNHPQFYPDFSTSLHSIGYCEINDGRVAPPPGSRRSCRPHNSVVSLAGT